MDYYLSVCRALREVAPDDDTAEKRIKPGELISFVPATYFAGTEREGLEYPYSETHRLDPHTKLIVVDITQPSKVNILDMMMASDPPPTPLASKINYWRKRSNSFNELTLSREAKKAIFDSRTNIVSRIDEAEISLSKTRERPPKQRLENA